MIVILRDFPFCERTKRDNIKNTAVVEKMPTLPWQKVASDLIVLKGKNYLLICETYSVYLDFQQLKVLSSFEVIESIKKKFSVDGVPEELQIDNKT